MINTSLFLKPDRIVDPTGWVGHIPFAFWVIETLKPAVFVELGTHTGNSYFSFCQSVNSNRLPTKCYAVDTWKGDEHAGFYDDTVFAEVATYNENQYHSFSRLIRMTFDDALSTFSDNSIDLLHIDGLHSYEAVKHDFNAWLPKLSHRGVILFHDINVRERDFGVWKLWEELSALYPHLAFDHSSGLGVLIVGGNQNAGILEIAKEFESLSGQHLIKSLFSRLGHMVDLEYHSKTFPRDIEVRDTEINSLNMMIDELENNINTTFNFRFLRVPKPIKKLKNSIRKRLKKLQEKFFSKSKYIPLSELKKKSPKIFLIGNKANFLRLRCKLGLLLLIISHSFQS